MKSLDIEAVAVDVPASAGRPAFKGCCKRRGGLDINVQSSDGGFAMGLWVSRIFRRERMVCFVGHESEEFSLPSKEPPRLPPASPPDPLDTSKGGVIFRHPEDACPDSKGLGVCDLDLDPEPEVTVLDPDPPDLEVLVDIEDAAGDVECRLLVV